MVLGGVARHFRHGLASGDRHDPEFATSKFGKPPYADVSPNSWNNP
jgi:hypothetical protein